MRLLALSALLVVALGLALCQAQEPPSGGITFSSAGTAAGTSSISTVAPVGSCSRCGRSVWDGGSFTGLNFRIIVSNRAQRDAFRGCWDCLVEVLERAEKDRKP